MLATIATICFFCAIGLTFGGVLVLLLSFAGALFSRGDDTESRLRERWGFRLFGAGVVAIVATVALNRYLPAWVTCFSGCG